MKEQEITGGTIGRQGETASAAAAAAAAPAAAVQIALTVESLRQAENLYTRLFGMRVAARDRGESEGGDGSLQRYHCVCPADGAGVAESDDPRAFRRSLLEGQPAVGGVGGFRLLLLVGVVDTRGDGAASSDGDGHGGGGVGGAAAARREAFAPGRVAHVGLGLAPGDLARVRARAGELSCRVLADSGGALVLEDPLGVRWRLSA